MKFIIPLLLVCCAFAQDLVETDIDVHPLVTSILARNPKALVEIDKIPSSLCGEMMTLAYSDRDGDPFNIQSNGSRPPNFIPFRIPDTVGASFSGWEIRHIYRIEDPSIPGEVLLTYRNVDYVNTLENLGYDRFQKNRRFSAQGKFIRVVLTSRLNPEDVNPPKPAPPAQPAGPPVGYGTVLRQYP